MLAGGHLGISKGLSAYEYHHVYICLFTDDQWLHLINNRNLNAYGSKWACVTITTEHNKVRPMIGGENHSLQYRQKT